MVRRIYFGFALLTLLIGIANIPAMGQSGRTFYIDYGSGSNSNDGTTKSTPWKTHPYMQSAANCTSTGSGPAYSHQAGDQFIFKGGVTWPAACFQLNVVAGGSGSGAQDYYGVDSTWFSGGSFTRPIFDMANTTPTGNSPIKARAQWITFDNIELKRYLIISGINECADANMDLGTSASGNITVKNMFIHDWTITALVSGSTSHGTGSICQNGASGPITADTVEMSDAATTAVVPFGACFRNLDEVKNSSCHNTGEGEVGHGSVHDSQFFNINGNAVAAYDSANHTNIIEASGVSVGDGPIYNNLIHDTSSGVTIFECNQATVYNNVMWNNANSSIMVDTNCPGASATTVANIYNNTVDCSTSAGCFRYFLRSDTISGIVNLQNNHWISNGTTTCFNNMSSGCANIVGGGQGNNVTMTTNTASSQGYTSANLYEPTSSTSGTVKAALSISNLCVGGLSSLCSDRLHTPRLLSWDAGAYEFSGQSSTSPPKPPSNLAAIVQ